MNVLVFIDDQHRADLLGFGGHPLVKTPHLDALASRGVYFNRMYTCSAVCGPSRNSFMTGVYPRTHEAHHNNVEFRRELRSLPGELRQAGYTTTLFGKSHITSHLQRQFDQHIEDHDYGDHLDECGLAEHQSTPLEHKNFYSFESQLPDNEHQEVWCANRTIDFLRSQQAKSNPFFTWCSFERPHSPHCPPKRFVDLYNPDDIEVDWEGYRRFEASRLMNRAMIEDFWKIGSVRHDPSIFQKAICRYLGLISMIDEQVGRVLEVLAQEGLADETIVVFTADHGDFAGRWGNLGKNVPGYEDLLRIPFVYYDPNRLGDGGRCVEGLYQNVDLFPSLMQRLGLETPPTVQGESFIGALDGYPGSTRHYIYAETPSVKIVRSMDWKLIFYAAHPDRGQLFRMGADPDETTNLWDELAYAHIKMRIFQELAAWMVRCEQPTGISDLSGEYVRSRWHDWLRTQPNNAELQIPSRSPAVHP